jgi:hypothetical protein
MMEKGKGSKVHPAVKNAIVIALGIPPILILTSIGIFAVGTSYRMAVLGQQPAIPSLPPILSSDLAIAAIIGGVAYMYLIWANVVFGSYAVNTATEQAQDIKDQVDGEGVESDSNG